MIAPGPRHFGAVMSAMVTPFDAQGRLDLDAAQRLARWLVERGNDGLVVAATTGEGSTLSDAERCDLVRAVSEAVTVPVLAGTGSNDTAHTIAPLRTGRRIAHEVLLRLFRDVPNIVAFKDATADPPAAARLVAEAGAPAPPELRARALEVWGRLNG
ncbi:MAG: dapA [Ramlibacter sp.]|jgi:4-hydroxy-tetrahydrodipicolinate synthase|nr:dapA [Ramlibacter sp.]